MPYAIQVDMNLSKGFQMRCPMFAKHFGDSLSANKLFSGLANSGSEAFNY